MADQRVATFKREVLILCWKSLKWTFFWPCKLIRNRYERKLKPTPWFWWKLHIVCHTVNRWAADKEIALY